MSDAAPRTIKELADWYAEHVGPPAGVSLSKAMKAWNDHEPRGTGQLIIHPVTGKLGTGFWLPASDRPNDPPPERAGGRVLAAEEQ